MIRSKPSKLRAACNQCAASKIKCSGEKTGCSSCENRGIKCVFAESRVGRVPGMRGKRKLAHEQARAMGHTRDVAMTEITNAGPAPLSPQTSDDLSGADTIDYGYTSSSTPSSHAPDTDHMGLFDETLLGWSTVSNGGLDDNYGFDERHTEDIFGSLQNSPPEPSQRPQQQLPSMNQAYSMVTANPSFPHNANAMNPQGMDASYQQPPPSHDSHFAMRRSASATTTTTSSPQIAQKDHSERNNQCVIACSQIIFSLEKYQVDKLKVLDFILGIVRGVTKKLHPLINGQFESPSTKCLALFDIILYQLVEILETGCADFLAETSNGPSPMSIELLEPGFHDLDFSGFGMGMGMGFKDQERFRSQIILEVLRPVIKLMQKALFISTSAGLDRDNCSEEGQSRLKALEEKVKSRAGGFVNPEQRRGSRPAS